MGTSRCTGLVTTIGISDHFERYTGTPHFDFCDPGLAQAIYLMTSNLNPSISANSEMGSKLPIQMSQVVQ
jgi:hypothetical protein